MRRAIFIAVMQSSVVENRAIAWYRNRYHHVTKLGGIVAPWYIAIYRDLYDTGIEMLLLTILIEVSKVSHNTSTNQISNRNNETAKTLTIKWTRQKDISKNSKLEKKFWEKIKNSAIYLTVRHNVQWSAHCCVNKKVFIVTKYKTSKLQLNVKHRT